MVTEGNSAAFDTLFARHSDAIYAMLLKFTGNSDDVDDLIQEAFMKAYLKIGLYDPKYDFGAWIYTIARNTFVDFSRSRKSNALNPQNLSPEIDNTAQSSSPTPEDYIINAQQRAQIERYISMLPEDYRQLFELRFLDEYSYEEIAEKLDMKLGTVKTRIFRVRNMMCRLITESEEQAKK
jgi:RNA polymerase sigma-70 factor (ECF subfamily)